MRRAAARFSTCAAAAIACAPAPAWAQADAGDAAAGSAGPPSKSIPVGDWAFRPSLELRLRGEFRRYPLDVGGATPTSTAVLREETALPLDPTPAQSLDPAVTSEWLVAERARLGLAVDRGPVTAAFTLQDARGLGTEATTPGAAPGEPDLPTLAPFEAYVDVHSRKGRRVFFRLGRQRVEWGDGRLLGDDDWSPTARSRDAARLGFEVGDFDVELLAALLVAPGAWGSNGGAGGPPGDVEGSGAQLYGLDAVWHLTPLLNAEATALARIVREPFPAALTPGDTFAFDLRLFGDKRGLRYAVEAAYEAGRIATVAGDRRLSALALAGRVELETALPWHLTFGAEGSYASGDDGPLGIDDTQHRFDPILPDQHDRHGLMDLWGWSNALDAGGDVTLRPEDELGLRVGYHFAGLAQPTGQWTTAALVPVGSSTANASRSLGHEIDAALRWTPWDPIRFDAGYGLFLLGEGAKNVVRDAARYVPAASHFVFLQTTVRAP